jgi:transposase
MIHSLWKLKGKVSVYPTILVDHTHRRVHDLFEGRSWGDTEEPLKRMQGHFHVRVVTIDLLQVYRALTREYLPNRSEKAANSIDALAGGYRKLSPL